MVIQIAGKTKVVEVKKQMKNEKEEA